MAVDQLWNLKLRPASRRLNSSVLILWFMLRIMGGKRKQREDEDPLPPPSNAAQQIKGSTLLVSNLPNNATSVDLQTLFSDIAPGRSAFVVLDKETRKSKGVGYVSFAIREERQLTLSSYTSLTFPRLWSMISPEEEVGRPRAKGFAFVWMMSKKDAEKAVEGANGATMGGNDDEDPQGNGKERAIAVGWALSKERWEEEKRTTVEDDVGEGIDAGSGGMGQDDNESGAENVGESGSDDRDNDDIDNDDAPDRPLPPPPEPGNAPFIRNVPFTTTEDMLRTLFRITLDAARSRGTAFVCFWNKDDADRAIQQAGLLTAETGGTQAGGPAKKNPFLLTSILTPDPSSSLARSLVMQGRTLDREKQDKRNLYLMRAGVIFPDTPAASTLSAAELEKRARINVRQFPPFVTERTLKRLAVYAVRIFEEEVKSGLDAELSPQKWKRKRGERQTAVRQAKIGCGFLEMMSHADALRVIRWANNHPGVEGLMRGWWKEELQDIEKKAWEENE
ncbi:hypothetical protein JB92DRAFT_3147322 [Gautieria morchelliformis]|nr:hypothetical protein JB92DRAFT_3147322 [Gautieria morchelliformis]